MTEIEQFSSLLGDIYDASLDPSRWTAVLENICAFLPGKVGNIFIQDAVAKRANALFLCGMDATYLELYLSKYIKLNPAFPALLFRNPGELFMMSDIMSDAQLRQTRFFREWLQPQGLRQGTASILEKSPTSCAVFAVIYPDRPDAPDQETVARMRLLVPHVQRAVFIGKALDLQKATAEMLTDVVDALAACVYLLDASGRIVHANRSGLNLLSRNDVLRSPRGLLHANDLGADRSLQRILASVSSRDGLAATGGGSVLLAARDGDKYACHVLPLTAGQRQKAGVIYSAVTAVFVRRAELNLSTFPELIARQFKLTPSELGVMFSIIEVGGVPEVADVLGLSQATVRTHLRNVFAKTGTKRQAELVKFMAQFANPIAS